MTISKGTKIRMKATTGPAKDLIVFRIFKRANGGYIFNANVSGKPEDSILGFDSFDSLWLKNHPTLWSLTS